MATPLVIVLVAVLVLGLGLLVRAWTGGMRFGERLEARERAEREASEGREPEDGSPPRG